MAGTASIISPDIELKTKTNSLTTHIFDLNDPYINSDAVFGVKESLLAKFKHVDDPDRIAELGFAGPFYEVEHDFVLAAN